MKHWVLMTEQSSVLHLVAVALLPVRCIAYNDTHFNHNRQASPHAWCRKLSLAGNLAPDATLAGVLQQLVLLQVRPAGLPCVALCQADIRHACFRCLH
jgi:hypothetical protein